LLLCIKKKKKRKEKGGGGKENDEKFSDIPEVNGHTISYLLKKIK
jgi:hypothetical protein